MKTQYMITLSHYLRVIGSKGQCGPGGAWKNWNMCVGWRWNTVQDSDVYHCSNILLMRDSAESEMNLRSKNVHLFDDIYRFY